MSNNNDGVLRKVRALLAQAEDPAATPEEAIAFSRKAEELIGKYAIETALLEAKDGKGSPVLVTVEYASTYASPKGTLLNALAMTNNCRLIRSGGSYKMAGYKSDLDAVELLYTSLLVQGEYAMLSQVDSSRSFRTSFWYGFANRVHERMMERNAAQSRDVSQGNALVLADRDSIVEDFFNDAFTRQTAGRSRRLGSQSGGRAGRNAGDGASFGDNHVGGKSARALAGA